MHFLEKHGAILRKIKSSIKSRDFGNMLDAFPTIEFVRKSRISEGSEEIEQLLIKENGRDPEVQNVNDEMEEGIMKRSITNQVSSLVHMTSNFLSVISIRLLFSG